MRNFAFSVLCLLVNVCGFSSHLDLGPEFLVSTTSPSANKSTRSAVAINSSGQAIIGWTAWSTVSDGRGNVFVSTRDSSGNWTAPIQINATSGGSANLAIDFPSVAINDSGEILVAWETNIPNSIRGNIYIATRDSNGNWSNEQRINATSSGSADFSEDPKVALNNSGQAIVAWRSVGGGVYVSSRNSSTSSWSSEEQLSTLQIFSNVSVAMNSSGAAVIAYDNGFFVVSASTRDSTTSSWSSQQISGNQTSGEAWAPYTAINDNGQAIISWSTYFGENIYASSRNSTTGSWSDEQQINASFGGSANRANISLVAINNSGAAVISWDIYEGPPFDIYAATRQTATSSWSAEEKINTLPGGFSQVIPFQAQLVINDSGQTVVTWEARSPPWNIYASFRESTTSNWSSQRQVNVISGGSAKNLNYATSGGPTANVSTWPTVAINNSGQTIITWYTFPSGNQNIYASEPATESNRVNQLYETTYIRGRLTNLRGE